MFSIKVDVVTACLLTVYTHCNVHTKRNVFHATVTTVWMLVRFFGIYGITYVRHVVCLLLKFCNYYFSFYHICVPVGYAS